MIAYTIPEYKKLRPNGSGQLKVRTKSGDRDLLKLPYDSVEPNGLSELFSSDDTIITTPLSYTGESKKSPDCR
jgi:hypothetical protein